MACRRICVSGLPEFNRFARNKATSFAFHIEMMFMFQLWVAAGKNNPVQVEFAFAFELDSIIWIFLNFKEYLHLRSRFVDLFYVFYVFS